MAPRALAGRSATPLDDALAFIEAHFDEPVRLEQLAALSALSISHFVTAFRKRFGLSPYRYLCDLRIQRAQTLLLSGMPGSVVAAEVGFFDQSHFGRHFKRSCGMTPSGYVRWKRAGKEERLMPAGEVERAYAAG
ncbi:AraC family transcriptional regulator [Robbsia sp. Bb-Pol-6]|uniref:AraC family transcriptional regulator n=1 Tax=Robbsia betulipollinis TaxID=2981849 RepID=A0ABT3ZSR2_9BURK|nr:AraC family transcriptional regulator [Robbsia betulipollinis]MCY0389265.1 AraC family transcriptional regulator [Robbsia betulipollinis]